MPDTATHPRWVAAVLAAVVAGGFVTMTAVSPAVAAPPQPAPAASAKVDSTGQALKKAERTHQAVRVDTATTATDTVTANPDGTVTLERLLKPARAKVDGQWHDLDATLHPNSDGSVSPTVTTGQLRLSGGGTGPLATMTLGGESLSLTAPMPLPKPTLTGGTASYAGVLPGVDLVVTADDQGGFSHVLVVHDAPAAANPQLKSLVFRTATAGLTLAADAHGNLSAKNRLGQAVFTAPTPLAWDSKASPAAAKAARTMTAAQISNAAHGRASLSSADGAGTTATVTPLPVTVTADTLTFTPPPMLTSANTIYPVYLDPSWTLASYGAPKNGYASVPASLPSSNKWNNSGDPNSDYLQVGNADGWKSRAMINFPVNVGLLRNADIADASLELVNTHAYSCTATRTNLYAPATTLSSGNATWDAWDNVAPGSLIANPSFAHGYDGCASAGVSFNIAAAISAAIAANRTTQTFWLRSPNESNSQDYKEFSAKTAKITVHYNHTPATPTVLGTSPTTSCAANPPSIVGDGSVSLYAKVLDSDGQTLGVTFKLFKSSDLATPLAVTDPTAQTAGSGTTSVFLVPRNTLYQAAAQTVTDFTWQVQTTDGFANSGISKKCTFRFDPTRTGKPGITPPAGFTIGQPATFTITAPEQHPGEPTPTGYLYQLNGAAPSVATADSSGNASVTVTPNRFANTLTVTSTSANGNIGQTNPYPFNAQSPATAAEGDLTGDGTTDLLTAGGNGMPPGLWLAAGTGAGSGTPFRINRGGKNLGLDGNGISSNGGPGDFTGSQVITGKFTGSGLQDVLVYYPTGPNAGYGAVISGNGDGSPLQTKVAGNTYALTPDAFSDDGTTPLQLAAAGTTSGNGYPYVDLLGISGDSTTGYSLALYPSGTTPAGYFGHYLMPDLLTPTGGIDWNTWTIATTQTPNGTTAMFLWQKTTGQLHLWTDLAYDPGTQQLTFKPHTLATGWNTNQPITLSAADVNNDGTPDLRAVGTGGSVTSYLVTSLTATSGTITAQPSQTIMTSTHAWMLNDGADNAAVTTAHDAESTLDLTATGSATWKTDDLFSPNLELPGTNGTLATDTNTVPLATNADFTVSAWVKPTAAGGGTVLSQDATNTTGFRLYAEPSDKSWRFGMSRTDTAVPIWDTAIASPNTVQTGAWTLLTATYRQTGGLMNLYVNGGLVGRATHPTSYNATKAFRIGAHKANASTYGGYIAARIAQVQTWNKVFAGNVAIFGFLPGKQLTYTEIDSVTGDHVKDLTSTTVMPWTPKAIATLNATTILVNDTSGNLYRIDITATDTTLYFNPPTPIDTGWTHILLSADGAGKLFGIAANGQLRRYDVAKAKPTASTDFANNTLIGTGFTLKTLTATGPGWILGTTNAGALLSYHILGAGDFPAGNLDPDGWGFVNLMSPGGGLYYGRNAPGGVYRYKDANPFDFNGSDVQYYLGDPVDTTGWNQILLSAQPNTVG